LTSFAGGVRKDLGDLEAAKRYWTLAEPRMLSQSRPMVHFSIGSVLLMEGKVFEGVAAFDRARASAMPQIRDRMMSMLYENFEAYHQPSKVTYDTLWRSAVLGLTLGTIAVGDYAIMLQKAIEEMEPPHDDPSYQNRLYYELASAYRQLDMNKVELAHLPNPRSRCFLWVYLKFDLLWQAKHWFGQYLDAPGEKDPTLHGYAYLALGTSSTPQTFHPPPDSNSRFRPQS